jgi:hypothetical protein
MKYHFFPILVFLPCMVLLASGVMGEDLLSMETTFTELWNNGNVKLPDPGLLTVPKGPGILTTTIIQEPLWKAGTMNGPRQVAFRYTGISDSNPVPGLLLGETYYQKGTIIGTSTGVSNGLPLTTISRYYSHYDLPETWSVQVLPAIMINTNHQFANKVRFTATWEPRKQSRITATGCDVSGIWKTNRGIISLADDTNIYDRVTIIGNFTRESKSTFEGRLSGPVLTGTWSEPADIPDGKKGRFTLFFKDDCCSFTGTWGTGESDANIGDWTGMRT